MDTLTYEDLLKVNRELEVYTRYMPEGLKTRFTVKRYPPKSIIHQKDEKLKNFGIVVQGEHRVLNELANGNIFMIEKNTAVSFLGEVALLGGFDASSVTIETITECLVITFSLEDFERWISEDIHFLRLLCQNVAHKLYSASYKRGERQYYSVRYVVLRYLIDLSKNDLLENERIVLTFTRQFMAEELGLTTKTLNRTIRELKEDTLIDIVKGKVAITKEQHHKMSHAALQYLSQGRRGASHVIE